MIQKNEMPTWMKTKGYIHVSKSLRISENWKSYKSKIENPDFVANYAFYPLLHSIIRERKYKKINKSKHQNKSFRTHNFKLIEGGYEKTSKNRPLHYASHFDALIYGYYASLISEKYENELKKIKEINESINAYRKIKVAPTKDEGKSTIHFANEVFEEIKRRGEAEEIGVLTFDIKSFFSRLDHSILEKRWANIMGFNELPKDHKIVFKSCTQFRYILKDDLRIGNVKSGRRKGFDEKKLCNIRKYKGYKCFFEDNKDFREHIKSGKLRIYKNPFYHNKVNVGIPQGLPISAVLANLYLLEFDKKIIENIVLKEKGFYRRYSDDIILICNVNSLEKNKNYIENLIKESNLEISTEKTEKFIFKNTEYNLSNEKRLTSFKIQEKKEIKDAPLIYLGFEFRGYNVCIKSTNVAKFYRRLISIVKRRAKRAKKNNNPLIPKAIFKNQVKKLYKRPLRQLDNDHNEIKQVFRKKTFLVKNEKGEFDLISKKVDIKKQSNYFSYLNRCVKIFDSKLFIHQHRKKNHILNSAIKRYLK